MKINEEEEMMKVRWNKVEKMNNFENEEKVKGYEKMK